MGEAEKLKVWSYRRGECGDEQARKHESGDREEAYAVDQLPSDRWLVIGWGGRIIEGNKRRLKIRDDMRQNPDARKVIR